VGGTYFLDPEGIPLEDVKRQLIPQYGYPGKRRSLSFNGSASPCINQGRMQRSAMGPPSYSWVQKPVNLLVRRANVF
jgi:hypothetical protein